MSSESGDLFHFPSPVRLGPGSRELLLGASVHSHLMITSIPLGSFVLPHPGLATQSQPSFLILCPLSHSFGTQFQGRE